MGRLARLFLFATLLLAAFATPGRAEPVLTVLYTGKTFGKYEPCPS
ncbi:hypothetical protein dsx2_0284 [Desulfovibrio sp. X2]|nr:hypothetical protein dsx2_0284 [Desulfovibrio sp. X2]